MGNTAGKLMNSVTMRLEEHESTRQMTSSLTNTLCEDTQGYTEHHPQPTIQEVRLPPHDSYKPSSTEHVRKPPKKDLVKFWVILLVFFMVVDSVLVGLLVTVCQDLADLKNSLPGLKNGSGLKVRSSASLKDSPFCLPCPEVYVNDIEVLQNRHRLTQKRDEQNGTLCCAQAHDDLNTLIGNMFIRVHYEGDRAAGRVRVTNSTGSHDDQSDVIKPYLLLEFDQEQRPLVVNGTHALPLKLSKREAPVAESNTSSSSPLFLHKNGRVRIAHPGHFYIYSQVPFSFNVQPTAQTQYIVRVRNGGETLLLENSVFPCEVDRQSCEHSFVGGVFLLEADDEVALRVSDHTCVDQQKGVQFGVHRL